ncbi:MAG: histone deacetylase family protein [Anaerolineae bacterium]
MSTGYVYDPIFLEHDLRGHPENRERLRQIMEALEGHGVLRDMVQVPAVPVSLERLQRVHSPAYVEQVRRISERGGGSLDPDTYVSRRSYEAALAAAGGLVALTEAVLAGELENGFALVRPPGHHAERDEGMGFCLFNNVAVAALAALEEHRLERVLIVDFDVHHGNATQNTFYRDPRVLYFSTHQYPYYPGTGHWREIGEGPGQGYTVNVPLSAGVGDEGYQAIFDELLFPLAERYQPELILVSAGYDAHWNDPLAGMLLSVSGYAHLARTLVALAQEVCGGRLVFTLEGGYHLQVLREGVLNTCLALLGRDQVVDSLGPAQQAEQDVRNYLNQLRGLHRLV